jgi:hypothetical protein
MAKTWRNAYDAAFKLKVINLAVGKEIELLHESLALMSR